MAFLSPLALAGVAPGESSLVAASPPKAAPSPSPYGMNADRDAVAAADRDGTHKQLDAELAAMAAGHAVQATWNFAIGDDLKVATDGQQPAGARLFHGGLIALNAFGPEELGLKSVEKGVFVVAEHAADSLAGKAVGSVGKLVVHDGAKLGSAEIDVAAKLVHEGNTVETLSTSSVKGVRTADFLVNGAKTELKTVSHITAKDVTGRVKDIICKAVGQAGNVIVDVRGQIGFTERDAERTYARVDGTGYSEKLDSVRFIGDGFDRTF